MGNIVVVLMLVSLSILSSACDSKKSGNSDSSAPAPAAEPGAETEQTSAFAGTVRIDLEPKDGAPAESVSGAVVTAIGRPEINATTDTDGVATITGVQPGSVAIIVTAGDLSLTKGPAAYGLKIDDVVISAGQKTDLGAKTLQETGSLTGVVDFFNNPNNLPREGVLVYVPGTSFDARTDDKGRFTLPGLPPGTYDVSIQRDGFAVTRLTGVTVGEGSPTDLGEVLLSIATGPEGSIAVASEVTATIGGFKRQILKSTTVNLTFIFDADAALMKVSDEPSFINKEWMPVKKSLTWGDCPTQADKNCWGGSLAGTAPTADGQKTLYVTFADLNGLESSPASVLFYVDTKAPVLTSMTLLYGWDQVGTTKVFADVIASDDGTGIADIAFSNDANTFSTAASAWTPFAARKDWTLANTPGLRTVYVKVRDYAGRESAVAADTITLGSTTVIKSRVYSTPLTLYKAQSPFEANAIHIGSDLKIEPGVELRIQETLRVDGAIHAIGTATDKIVITTKGLATSGVTCHDPNLPNGELQNALGLPAVSEGTRVEHTVFRTLMTVKLNGGIWKNNIFDASACDPVSITNSGYDFGRVEKTGTDLLEVTNNEYKAYSQAIQIAGGDGRTQFKNNTGYVTKSVIDQDMGKNTLVTGNHFSFVNTSSVGDRCFFKIGSSSAIEQTDTSSRNTLSNTYIPAGFSAARANFVCSLATADLTFRGFRSQGASCEALVIPANSTFSAIGDITIIDADVSDCLRGVNFPYPYTLPDHAPHVVIKNSAIRVSQALVSSSSPASFGPKASVEFITNSLLRCANASAHCDLVRIRNDNVTINGSMTADITFDRNHIDCPYVSANEGCRGFQTEYSGGYNSSFSVTLNLSGNTFEPGSKIFDPNLVVNESTSPSSDTSHILLHNIYNGSGGSLTTMWSVTQ